MKNPNGLGSVYKLPGKQRNPFSAVITDHWTLLPMNRSKSEKLLVITRLVLMP